GDVIGLGRVVGGVAEMAAGTLAPGKLYIRGSGRIGLAPRVPEQRVRVAEIASEFGKAFPCRAEDDLKTMLWRKLLWNAPFNALCALTRRRAGRVLESPELEVLVRTAMLEVLAVARAEGAELNESAVDDML